MKFSLILEASNRMSRPLDQGRKSFDQLGTAAKGTGSAIGTMDKRLQGAGRTAAAMDRRMGAAERSARNLGQAGELMGSRIAAGARRGAAALAGLERRMQLSHETMGALAFRAGGLIGSTLRTGALAGTAIGGAAVVGGVSKVVRAGTENEQLKAQLILGNRGDVRAAQRDMNWISDFAAKTPYDMAGVTQAFIAARGAGIDPMNGSLQAMGDAAAALGKTYDDAIQMMMDAQNGEFARLPEFQIKAAQKNGVASFRYFDRSGKEMVKSVKMAGHNVERALTEIMVEKYGGAMDAIARTTEGKWDALSDRLHQRAVKVWDQGFGKEVQLTLDRITQAFDEADADGAADRWSQSTSDGLSSIVKQIREADWDAFSKDVKGLAGTFGELAQMAGWAAGKLGDVRKWMAEKELQADKYSILGSLESYRGGLRYNPPDWAKSKAKPAPKPSGVPFFEVASVNVV